MKTETIQICETNIDDMAPLFYETVFEKLFASGAKDVFVAPIIMKKNRPAHTLSVIYGKKKEKEIMNILFSETSTIGVRISEVRRITLERKNKKIKTKYGSVSVKECVLPDGKKRLYPEYEDCKQIAKKKNVLIMDVYDEVKKNCK